MKIDITDSQLDALFEALKTKVHIAKTLENRAEYIKYSRLINYLTITRDADTGYCKAVGTIHEESEVHNA